MVQSYLKMNRIRLLVKNKSSSYHHRNVLGIMKLGSIIQSFERRMHAYITRREWRIYDIYAHSMHPYITRREWRIYDIMLIACIHTSRAVSGEYTIYMLIACIHISRAVSGEYTIYMLIACMHTSRAVSGEYTIYMLIALIACTSCTSHLGQIILHNKCYVQIWAQLLLIIITSVLLQPNDKNELISFPGIVQYLNLCSSLHKS